MATYVSKDQNWGNDSTTYWFDVDGTQYGVVEAGPESYPVDHNSHPIDDNEALARQIVSACIVTDGMRSE